MTRRKDHQPEVEQPQDVPPPAEPVSAEPFVVSDPVDHPTAEPPTLQQADAVSTKPPEVIVRRGSFIAPLLGGALAAMGGYGLAHFDVFGLRPADTAPDSAVLSTQLSEMQAEIDRLSQLTPEIATLADRVAQVETAPAPEAPDLSRLDAFEQRLSAIEAMPTDGAASTAAVTAKLADLERRLAALPQGASPELQQELDAALARLDEAEANAAARAEEAAAATAAAERTRALDALAARLSAGEPFPAELEALQDDNLAQALAPLAESGVPTLAKLQGEFPDAAREALRIARDTNGGDGWGDRFLDFLAGQTGARPLTPLEGETPEAVLSRADFALAEGRVADAVAELQPLDPAIKTALDPWLAQAQAYLSATAALQAARGE